MSENAFYDLIKRYSEEKENGLIDKSKKPKESKIINLNLKMTL